MPKKGVKTPRPPIGDPNDAESLFNYMRRFLLWQAEKNYSPKTIENREVYLRYFIQWCDERGINKPPEITKPIIERYQRYLAFPWSVRWNARYTPKIDLPVP